MLLSMLLLLSAALAAPPEDALRTCMADERADQCLSLLADAAEVDVETLNKTVHVLLMLCSSREDTGCALEGEDGQEALIARWCSDTTQPALCLHLGELRERGIGEPRDKALALKAMRAACDGGSSFACLGMMRNGDDYGKTVLAKGYREGCLGGSAADCDQLVLFSEDPADQVMGREKACEANIVSSCYSLALYYIAEGDDSKTMSTLEKACQLGSSDACQEATQYQSFEEEISKHRAGCDARETDACYALGQAFSLKAANLPSATYVDAAEAFEVGCEKRHQPSCGELGRILYQGIDVPEDEERALKLYKNSCKAEYWPACDGYARMLRFGEATDVDVAKAVSLLERACAEDYADACWSLGWIREDDEPARDPRKAVEGWLGACTNGVVDGCEEVIKRLGDAATVADAQLILSTYTAKGEAGAEDLRWWVYPALKKNVWLAEACAGGNADACTVQGAIP